MPSKGVGRWELSPEGASLSTPIITARPDGSSVGALSIDMAVALARAQQERAAACFLRPRPLVNDALFSLRPTTIERVETSGVAGAWQRIRWAAREAVDGTRARAIGARSSFWLEIYRELRRHIGDARLPYPLRTRLRDIGERSLAWSETAATLARPTPFPRRLLRERIATALPADVVSPLVARWPELAPGRRVVTLEVRSRFDRFRDAIDVLIADGYAVAYLGQVSSGGVSRSGVIDLSPGHGLPEALPVLALLSSEFLVCESPELQRVAYLTNTPCLMVNAIDPFAAYPVRGDGVYTLATAVNLETGEALGPDALLDEGYVRQIHRFGHRLNASAEILAAVTEMQHGLHHGWHETEAQARYRARVVDAGAGLAGRVPRVEQWGPDRGFIGDGRLARVQADRQDQPA